MLWFDFLSIWAVIMVVVHVSVLWWVFNGVRVVWRYLRHESSFLILLGSLAQAYLNGFSVYE